MLAQGFLFFDKSWQMNESICSIKWMKVSVLSNEWKYLFYLMCNFLNKNVKSLFLEGF